MGIQSEVAESVLRVLVVGAEGFVGRHLVSRLGRCGHAVWASYYPLCQPPQMAEAKWVASDLSANDCTAQFPTVCDAVVFLAQSMRWRSFPDDAQDVFAVNVVGAMKVVEYARRAGAKSFLYASSGSIYAQDQRPNHEDDLVALGGERSFYVASKIATESLLGPYSACLNVITVRLFFPYGSGQNPNMLFPNLVKRVREGQPIVLHGPDGLHFNPTVAEDVAETLVRLLHAERSAVVNVGGPEALTLRAVGEAIGRELGLPVRFEEHAEEPTRVMVGRTDRLRELLGWTPQTPFAIGLRQWLRENEA